jgi:hypothetical protein
MDDKIRRLERQAAAGDPASNEELWRNKRRTGETVVVQCPECRGLGEAGFAESPNVNMYSSGGYVNFGNAPTRTKCDACDGWGKVRTYLENIPIYRPTKPQV